MSHGKFVQYVREAKRLGFLVDGDLCELGLFDVVDATQNAEDVRKLRRIGAERFINGLRRMNEGLLPEAVHVGAEGRIFRPSHNEAEAKAAYSSWIASVEACSGSVKTYGWVPSWYFDSQDADGDEGLSDYDLEQWDASRADSEHAGDVCDTVTVLSLFHPTNLRQLRLWFGGREWSPYPHAIVEWWIETSGDDLGELVKRKEECDRARILATGVIERAAGRK